MRVSISSVLTLVFLTSCSKDAPTASPGGEVDVSSAPADVQYGINWLVESMDRGSDPCTDFYRYACGGWAAATERPADKARYSRAFSGIQDRNYATLRTMLEAWSSGEVEKDYEALAGRLYGACMDEAGANAGGIEGLSASLAAIDAMVTTEDFMATVGTMHGTVFAHPSWLGGARRPLFNIDVDADFKEDPDTNILHVAQGGLGLPSRELYLDDNEGAKKVREVYEGHIANMLGLSGVSEEAAPALAQGVLAFETQLAMASKPPAELRDPTKRYFKEGVAGLNKRAAGLAWDVYFERSGFPSTDQLNISTPDFFEALPKIVGATEAKVRAAYLRYHLIQGMAPMLSATVDEAAFALAMATQGVESQPPRWERCVNRAMVALPDAVGPGFVEVAFGGDSKPIADDMINRINGAMEASFPTLAWMDDATREAAKGKISTMTRKIGYPDAWEPYAGLALGGNALANSLAINAFKHAQDVGKVNGPVDKAEWHMPSPLVNAYYNPTSNEIAFPAGIMQPPFFGAGLPQAMNYGGIGAVIGHELTHGFDDQGAKYDAKGMLREWWTPQVRERFDERVACVVAQYDAYEPLPGVSVNGKLTAGENIADIGGVKEAYVAYKSWESEDAAREASVVPNMSNEQVFFVAWAQNWCHLSTEASVKRRVEGDSHSPGEFRANGPLVNLPEFAEAFTCGEGTPMNPVDRCLIW
jgi:endothelin-converting enzyme/putative endopeptidase